MSEENSNFFFLSSFFGLPEETTKNILDSCMKEEATLNLETFYTCLGFYDEMSDESYRGYRYGRTKSILSNEDRIKALQNVVLDFALNLANEFTKMILSKDEYQKALQCYERGQYNNKGLQSLLKKACYLLSEIDGKKRGFIKALFKIPFSKELSKIYEKNVLKEYGLLRNVLNEITSGVDDNCFKNIDGENSLFIDENRRLVENLNAYINEKYKYDYNAKCYPYYEKFNRVLQLLLFENANFWENHKYLSIASLLNNILKYNGFKHSQKIIDFIFEKLLNDPNGKRMIEHSFPVEYYFVEDFCKSLEVFTWRHNFGRFKDKFDLDIVKDIVCCYPLNSVENVFEKINQGKDVIQKLYQMVYLDDYEKVIKFIYDKLEDNQTIFNLDDWTMRKELEITSGPHIEFIKALCSEYFTVENILNRLYLLGYYFTVLTGNEKDAEKCVFEVFYNLFEDLNKEFNIETSFQRDIESRELIFHNLKNFLIPYDIFIKEEYKNFYIISQLDRKVATSYETEQFPVLEQLGDAIYGLAVAEQLFYNPELYIESVYEGEISLSQLYQDYTSAKMQVTISKKIGLDRFYFSPVIFQSKYNEDSIQETDEEYLRRIILNEKETNKYLADSLEMLIGAICKEFGYQSALNFSKQLLREVYPEVFTEEIRFDNYEKYVKDDKIDVEYWATITPGIHAPRERNHDMLWTALDKFLRCYILGTEEKNTRNFITQRNGTIDIYAGIGRHTSWHISKLYYEYFTPDRGLKYVIDNYSDSIKENYKKITEQ